MLEARSIRVIRRQLIIGYIIAEIQSGHFGSGRTGSIAPVLQLVVIDIGHVSDRIAVVVICSIIGIIDGDEGSLTFLPALFLLPVV